MNDRNGWCDKGTKTSTKTAVLKLDMLMWDRKGISLSRKVVLLYYLGPSMAVASEGLKVMPLGISDSAMWFLSPTWNSRPLPQRRCFQDLWGLLFFFVGFRDLWWNNWMLTATTWLVPGPDTGGYRHCLSEWCLWAVLTGRACLVVFFSVKSTQWSSPILNEPHEITFHKLPSFSKKEMVINFIDVYYVETNFRPSQERIKWSNPVSTRWFYFHGNYTRQELGPGRFFEVWGPNKNHPVSVGIDPVKSHCFCDTIFLPAPKGRLFWRKNWGKFWQTLGKTCFFLSNFLKWKIKVRCFSLMMTTMTMCKVILDDELISSSGGWMMYGI